MLCHYTLFTDKFIRIRASLSVKEIKRDVV